MNKENLADVTRRDFLRGSSLTTLMMLMGAVEIRPEDKPKAEGGTDYKAESAPVNCGVIGCGTWGREILTTLARLPNAPVIAICDSYPAFVKRAKTSAPKAQTYSDHKKLLEQEAVQAVLVATPSHLHREIVIDALKAGKHVYCEAPLAHTVEDAQAIAQAAKAHFKLNFQVGLQSRADKQIRNLLEFVRTGVMGRNAVVRAQYHKKNSWRRTSPTPEREKELNWRLERAISPGLAGEIGVHQIDLANWFLLGKPVAVTGFGSTIHWNDGRDVPDTVHAIFEYPGGVRFIYEASLATSFDGEYALFHGTDSTIMLRDRRAWMFKEVDAPLLGWEVYARKETFFKESGIVLGANATKIAAQGTNPTLDPNMVDDKTALQYSLESFLVNSNTLSTAVEDFTANFDASDTAALKEYLASLSKSILPAAGYREGYEATVAAIKANEAILGNKRVVFGNELFEL